MALYPLNIFSQKKSHLPLCAKTATSHMHITFLMHGKATKACLKGKGQHTVVHTPNVMGGSLRSNQD